MKLALTCFDKLIICAWCNESLICNCDVVKPLLMLIKLYNGNTTLEFGHIHLTKHVCSVILLLLAMYFKTVWIKRN